LIDFTNAVYILAARQVESPPGRFMGPIARAFGFLIDALFNVVYAIGPVNSLGITIVLMTIIFRLLMTPLTLKSQKSMMKMKELKPELDKIKAKYGSTKDPELMRKSQQEQSALLAKHGANPLSGCLPMLIQMPLFIGLNIVMRQASLYIDRLGRMYYDLAVRLQEIPELVGSYAEPGIIRSLAEGRIPELAPIIPPRWMDNLHALSHWLYNRGLFYTTPTRDQMEAGIAEVGDTIILGWTDHLAQVINRFTDYDWQLVYESINEFAPEQLAGIESMVENVGVVETFFGISIVESSGWVWPGVLIPVLTGVSMFISSWLMQQRTYDANADERTQMTQKLMLFVMPVFMAFITVGLVAAVGVFWITGQIFQVAQDIFLLKKSGTVIRLPFAKPPVEVVDSVPAKKK